ncbi:hypothetical protein [Herbidospora sp. RD11066]
MGNIALSTKERALLLGLMTLGGTASNPELKAHIGDTLDGAPRLRLNKLSLVESVRPGRAFVHTMTENGWAWCVDELSADAPERAGSPLARVLYSLLGVLNGYLDAADLSLAEFVGTALGEPTGSLEDTAAAIRDAYWKLAREPQDWVRLTLMRPLLGGIPVQQVDDMLRELARTAQIVLIPQADQKTLTDDDRRAAVYVGGVDKHLIAIEA